MFTRNSQSDIRYAPAYTLAEAARYLRMPAETLRTWVYGREYESKTGKRHSDSLIRLDNPKSGYLSFLNLVEAHVLAAMRRQHRLQLLSVRRALDYVRKEFRIERPLVDQTFQTDGLDLFVERYEGLINVSQSGQRAMKEIVCAYLRRIDRDARGIPIRLYPFTRIRETVEVPKDEPSLIVFAPDVSFGKPVIAGTGIPVEEIVSRFEAGDSADEIAEDFRVGKLAVEEAIRYQAAA